MSKTNTTKTTASKRIRTTYEIGDRVETPIGMATVFSTPDEQGGCKVKMVKGGEVHVATTYQLKHI